MSFATPGDMSIASWNRSAFAGIGGAVARIKALVRPATELIVDGQSLNDLGGTATWLDLANYESPTGAAIVSVTETVTAIIGGLESPSSLSDTREQTDEVRVVFTVLDADGLTRDFTVYYTVFPVATQATAGNLTLNLTLNTGVELILFDEIFEPVVANDRWVVPATRTLTNAPSAVTLGTNGVLIDKDSLAAQENTIFSVTVQDVVTPGPVTRTATKTIDLTATANVIGIVTEPAFVQGFEGGAALDDSNRATLLEPANYTGLTDATLNVRMRVDGSNEEILTYAWQEGDVGRLYADVFNNGRTPGDGLADATFISDPMTVQTLLTLSDTSGTALSVTVNPTAPDTYPVNGFAANNRPLDDGLIVADFKSDQMALIQSPLFTAPTTALGDDLTYTPPTVVAPDGATVTVTYDLLNAADDSVILSDQTFTTDTLNTTIDAGLQGLTVYRQAKFRATGLNDLDVDSPTIAIDAAAGYTQTVFSTGSDGHLLASALPATCERIVVGAWVTSDATLGMVFDTAGGTQLRINGNGSVRVLANYGAGNYFRVSSAGGVSATNLTFVGLIVDRATGTRRLQVGGVTENSDVASLPEPIDLGAMTLFENENGGDRFTSTFADVVIDIDGTLTLADLYNGGTPPNPSSLTADIILGDGQTAADLSAGNNLGTATLTVPAGADTFVEV